MASIEVHEMPAPMPHSQVQLSTNPTHNTLRPQAPTPTRSPDLPEYMMNDAPPSYATAISSNATTMPTAPSFQAPLVTEAGGRFRLFRFGANVSRV